MKKLFLMVLLSSLFFSRSFAQDKNEKIYKERSEEVKKEIWGEKNPAFEVNTVPEEFKNEGAVIIARDLFYSQDRANKVKLTLFGPSFKNSRNNYITTIREKVKINDQRALEEYATLEYRKAIDKTTSFGLFSKNLDKAFTFIGVKITKADGKTIEQNMDEEVLTKDEKKLKEGKIAISNLQLGDILEYYIRIEEVEDNSDKTLGPYFFVMGGDHPMLDLKVKFIVNKKAGIAYRAANGAPKFKESTNEKGDFEFELHQKNLPKIIDRMWQMPYRQLPYIVFSYKTVGGYKKPYIAEKITSSVSQDEYLEGIQPILDLLLRESQTPVEITTYIEDLKDKMQKGLGGKLKNFDADSLAITLFYTWQHSYGYSFKNFRGLMNNSNNETNPVSCEGNDYSLYDFYMLLALHKLMQKLEIDNELVVVTPVNSPKSEDILSFGDYDLLLRTKTKTPIYFTMDNRFYHPQDLPVRYQGQTATILDVDLKKSFFGKSNTYTRTPTTLPKTTANDNSTKETINVSFNPAAMTIAETERTVAVSGHYKTKYQKMLCLPEETDKRNAKILGINSYIESLNESRRTRDVAETFQKAMDEVRKNWKDDFKAEIKDQFDIEPKEVISYDIVDYALRYWNKNFIYKEKFTMEGWTKKAGNNYLFEAGKLIGTYTRVDDKERERNIDIYMPCARTFEFNITINIPEGFNAKGMEAFNKNVTNASGAFVSTATLSGKSILIAAKRTMVNGFEPASNWKNLLAIMDACTDFTTQKILFEKAK